MVSKRANEQPCESFLPVPSQSQPIFRFLQMYMCNCRSFGKFSTSSFIPNDATKADFSRLSFLYVSCILPPIQMRSTKWDIPNKEYSQFIYSHRVHTIGNMQKSHYRWKTISFSSILDVPFILKPRFQKFILIPETNSWNSLRFFFKKKNIVDCAPVGGRSPSQFCALGHPFVSFEPENCANERLHLCFCAERGATSHLFPFRCQGIRNCYL